MLLNSTAVAESITESDYSKRTQIGIDLSVSKVEKIISGGSGLIFKGSGFYLTDYKDNKKNKSKE